MKFNIEFTDEQVGYFEFLKSCEARYADAEYTEDFKTQQFYFSKITSTREEYCKRYEAPMLDLLTDLDLYFMCKYHCENKNGDK